MIFINQRVKAKQVATRLYDWGLAKIAPLRRDSVWSKIQSKAFPTPKCVYINNVNFCNAKCVFCGQHKFQRPHHVMEMEVFQKIASQSYMLGIQEMDFTPTLGEALLDKQLVNKVKYARTLGFRKITMTTNGILLTREIAKHFDLIRVSIGGLDSESYKEAYGVDKFSAVYINIYNIAKDNPQKIHLFFRSGKKPSEILRMLEFSDFRDVSYEFTNLYDNWGGSVKSEELVGEMKMRSIKKKIGIPCFSLMLFFVDWNGNIRLCGCRFKDKEEDDLVVGNIMKNSLTSILKNVNKVIERFKAGAELPDVCKDCTLYRPILTY